MVKNLKKIIAFFSIILALAIVGGAIYFYKVNIDVFSPNIIVTFEADDADFTNSEIKLKKGNCVVLPVLTKEGYDFVGWFCGETKWEENTPIKQNTKLVAKFNPKKFQITFIVDEKNYYVFADYDTIPQFSGTPNKEPTETTQFDFVRFEPELVKVSGEATYTAVFEEVVRKFNVNLSSNYENACNFTYSQKVDYNTSTTISLIENDGYNFVGFFDENDSLFSSNKSLVIENVKKDINLTAKFDLIEYNITYVLPSGTINNNPTKYVVTDGNVPLQDLSLDGYIFKGFFSQSDGKGEKVNVLNIMFVKNYSVLYAYFTQQISVKFVVDGLELTYDEIQTTIGNTIESPVIDTSKYGMSAQTIYGWYTNSDCSVSSKFNFSNVINNQVILYGKWKYILDNGFYEYLVEFEKSRTTKSVYIDNEEKLIKFIEFVQFYNITSENAIKIKFGSGSTDFKVQYSSLDDLKAYTQSIIYKSEYPNGIQLFYTYYGVSTYTLQSVYVANSSQSLLGSKIADPQKNGTTEQYEFGFLQTSSGRSLNFDSFNVNNIKNEISVTNSNQLVYALEKGLKPVPVSGSGAEIIYNKAKNVLRQICDDDMSDFEKIKSIYDWLIVNVQYDNVAANTDSIINEWQNYDAWYPEGVFNNQKAVCDGLARSLLILARIENIATIRVGGAHNGSGHAWNKVYINGNWYGIDATHGNPNINGEYEILTYSSFLFTDSYKQQCCTFNIKEGTETKDKINVYEKMSFSYGLTSFDLYINNLAELKTMVSFVKSYSSNSGYYQGKTNHNYFTIEFALAENSGLSINTVCFELNVYSFNCETVDGGLKAYSFKIKIS